MPHPNPEEATGPRPAQETAAPPAAEGLIDLNLLRTFVAVHQAGSFTAAGHVLGLSQPTVTAQIRTLERRLGRELFERLPRGVAPSPYADELAARLAPPLDALTAAAGEGGGTGAARPGPVHLAGPAEVMAARVLPELAPLVEDGVRLRVTLGLAEPLLAELRAGRHDLVIASTRPRGRTLESVPLLDEEFVLVAAPTWARRIGAPGRVEAEGPAALDTVPLITYAEDLPIARRYWRYVFGQRLTRQAAVTVPDLRGVLAAVVAGAGFSVLPRYLCLSELASGALVPLHVPEDAPLNTGFLVQRPGVPANPHVLLVRDRLLRAGRTW